MVVSDDDEAGHGKGYIDTHLYLYNVSEAIDKKKPKKEDLKVSKKKKKSKKRTFVPENYIHLRF